MRCALVQGPVKLRKKDEKCVNAILLMRLEAMAYHMSLKESSYKENGAIVILGIVHLLGQVAVIYDLSDAENGTVTVVLNLNIVLMRYVRVTVNVNVMSLIQTLSQNAFVTKNTPAIFASLFMTIMKILMETLMVKWTVLISMMITMEYLMFSSLNMKDLIKVPGNPVKINDLLYAHASNLILNAVRISIFRKDRSKFHMSHIK